MIKKSRFSGSRNLRRFFIMYSKFYGPYRTAARHAQDTGLGADHIGFRTVLVKS